MLNMAVRKEAASLSKVKGNNISRGCKPVPIKGTKLKK